MITGVIGKPRAGKTTYSCKIVQDNKKKLNFINKFNAPFVRKCLKFLLHSYDVIYCTDDSIQDCIHISYKYLGYWRPAPNSLLILEEAGIGLNNRNWKDTSNHAQHLFALHGHIGCDILWSSQTVDVDKKLLDRTHFLYLCKKSIWPNRSVMDLITFSPGVNHQTKKLENMYDIETGFLYFMCRLMHKHFMFNRKPYYKYFDSFVDEYEYPYDDTPC